MTDTGRVPPSLQLATSIPLGIRAYRRRCINPAQQIPSGGAGPGSYVNIYLDTSTPGTFFDPEGAYLEFDVTLTNRQCLVDYQNFGVLGLGPSLIQEMRVYNQGTPMEEILEYPTACTLLENLEANQEQDVYFYFSSILKQGFQKTMHKNFIKPPMVDRGGNIMFGPNPQGLGISFHTSNNTQYANSFTNQTVSFTASSGSASGFTTPTTTLPAISGAAVPLSVTRDSGNTYTQAVSVTALPAQGLTCGFTTPSTAVPDVAGGYPAYSANNTKDQFFIPGLISKSYFYSPSMRQIGSGGVSVLNMYQNQLGNYYPNSVPVGGINTAIATGNGVPLYSTVSNSLGTVATGINLNGSTPGTSMNLASCTQNPPFCSTVLPIATSSFTLPAKWANELKYVVAITPMDFPDKFSPDMVDIVNRFVREYGTINKQQVMDNLCNVKCFPIGMIPVQSAFNTNSYGQPETNVYNCVGCGGSGSIAETSIDGTIVPVYGSPVVGGNGNRVTATRPIPSNPVYRVCFRLTSGILGKLATKMLALCLLSPNQLYLNLRLADAATIYKVSADPCRRISGTIRDYIRNIGNANGAPYGAGTYSKPYNVPDVYSYSQTSLAPGYSPAYSIPLNQASVGAWDMMASVSTLFSEAAATGKCLNSTASFLIPPYCLDPAGITATSTSGLTSATYQYATAPAAGTNNNQLSTTYQANRGFLTMAPVVSQNGLGQIPGTVKVNPPVPQYALTLTPWMYKAINTASTTNPLLFYANESQVFYGTSLEASVPQVSRIFSMNYDGSSQGDWYRTSPSDYNDLTYSINNIQLVYDELVVSDSITADIIMQAESGDYNVHTNSIRTYTVSITNGLTQNISIPAKVSYAKRILFVFQNVAQRSSFVHDSNCGLNPFALVESQAVAGGSNTQVNIPYSSTTTLPCGFISQAGAKPQPGTLYGCGMTNPLNVIPTPNINGSFSAQFQIGNEFIPPQPLTSIADIVAENMKTVEGWSRSGYSPNVQSDLIVAGSSANYGASGTAFSNTTAFDVFKDKGFTTAYIPIDCLDDQTITGNFDFAPLYSYYDYSAANTAAVSGIWGACTELTIGSPKATRNSALNGYNFICPRGYCLQGLFECPSSTFFLGFNLRSWKTSDGVESGMYLGNNNLFLKLTGAVGLTGLGQTYRLITIVPHRAVMKYSANGVLTWIY